MNISTRDTNKYLHKETHVFATKNSPLLYKSKEYVLILPKKNKEYGTLI